MKVSIIQKFEKSVTMQSIIKGTVEILNIKIELNINDKLIMYLSNGGEPIQDNLRGSHFFNQY